MDYKCNNCDKLFEKIDDAIRHMKKTHAIKEHNERINCIVNFHDSDHCKRSYLTFNGLKTHVISCVKTKPDYESTVVRI